MYDNLHSDIDNLVREGHSPNLIRDSILSTLEGHLRNVAKTAMDDGNGSLHCIMTTLDHIYGGATSFCQLINKLNTIAQGNGNHPRISTKEYFRYA